MRRLRYSNSGPKHSDHNNQCPTSKNSTFIGLLSIVAQIFKTCLVIILILFRLGEFQLFATTRKKVQFFWERRRIMIVFYTLFKIQEK